MLYLILMMGNVHCSHVVNYLVIFKSKIMNIMIHNFDRHSFDSSPHNQFGTMKHKRKQILVQVYSFFHRRASDMERVKLFGIYLVKVILEQWPLNLRILSI